jgi:hypothetical protein
MGSAQAGLTLDLNGAGAGGVITADALDWAPTSFFAKNGVNAIAAFEGGLCSGTDKSACTFDVYTHAKLTGYKAVGGANFIGLPAGDLGEITVVAHFQEVVTLSDATNRIAAFRTNGVGSVEFYWSSAANSAALTGSNFNDGTLIGRLLGTSGLTTGSNSSGLFQVTDDTPVQLDQAPPNTAGNDQFPGQETVSGTGSQGILNFGKDGVTLDASFFLTDLSAFSIFFENISIGLPFVSIDPSDCFNNMQAGRTVGTAGYTTECNTTHVDGKYSDQNAGDPGMLPVVGDVNGLFKDDGSAPDFVAQTDFNSPVTGAVPEPGTLALLGLGLAGIGALRRRRS